MITGTSPDFYISAGSGAGSDGIDGGDVIYFKDNCTGAVDVGSDNSSVAYAALQYGNDVIGPECDATTAVALAAVTYSASAQQLDECGGEDGLQYIGMNRPQGWCTAAKSTEMLIASKQLGELMDSNDPNRDPWIQMSLDQAHVLGAIRSQGRADVEMWVSEYAVAYSSDGVSWTDFTATDGSLIIFDANRDQNSIAENTLPGNIVASHVRVFPKAWEGGIGIGMRVALMACPTEVIVQMPSSPALVANGVEARTLKACFATRRTEGELDGEFYELSSGVRIVPEPWQVRVAEYGQQGQLGLLTFNGLGEATADARYQDLVFIVPSDVGCDTVLTTVESFPDGPSGPLMVSKNSTLDRDELMAGRVNELEEGFYTLCYATSESGGNSNHDFSALSTPLHLTTLVTYPTVAAPRQVAVGDVLVVRWTAASGTVSSTDDWIGVFEYGACPQPDLSQQPLIGQSIGNGMHLTQNKCYKLSKQLVAGLSSGEVRFETATLSGEVEARFFAGSSRDSQGNVCRRLHGTQDESFKYCALESVASSGKIFVGGELADGNFDYLDSRDKFPGMEMACNKGRCVTGEVPDTVQK